jgi:hypothetical protein
VTPLDAAARLLATCRRDEIHDEALGDRLVFWMRGANTDIASGHFNDSSSEVQVGSAVFVGDDALALRKAGVIGWIARCDERGAWETASREAIVYGIRDKHTGAIRYVGQTATSLAERKAHGYGGLIGKWMKANEWEYVVLARCRLERAAQVELEQIELQRLAGVQLLNTRAPVPSAARIPGLRAPIARRSMPFRATREEFEDQDRRARAAGLSWNEWARRKLLEPSSARSCEESGE